jgi:hypothetical protein
MKQITHLLSAFIVLTTALPTLANFLVVEGRLTEAGGLSPIEEPSVTFTLDVLSPGPEACRLYRESHTLNMSGTRGYFNLKLGDGVRSGTGFANTATIRMALDNGAGTINSLTCQSGTSFTPTLGNHRLLRISYDLGAGPQVLGQNIEIGASGYALSAENIDGLNATDLLIQREDAGFVLNQGNLETIFTDTNYPELMALLNGTSSTYLSSMPAAHFSMNSNRITDLDSPVDSNDATNKNYVDSTIVGLSTDPSLASLSVAETGHILKWNGTQWVSEELTLENDITALDGRVTTNETDITNLTTRVTDNESDISTLQGQMTTANTNISSLDGRVTANEGAITALDTNKVNRAGDTMSGNLTLADREVRFTSGGANFVGLRAPDGLSADQVWTLPSADGSSGQVLQTSGSGNFSWVNIPAPDNLGNHMAVQDLDMSSFNIINVGDVMSSKMVSGNQIIADDGDAMTPAFRFQSSPDTGIFSPSVNSIALGTAGTQRLTINAMGLTGVGTAAPQARLHVQGALLLGDDGQPCNMDSEGALRKNNTDNAVEICNNDGGVYSWARMVKEKTCPIGWNHVGKGHSKICIRIVVSVSGPATANQACFNQHPESHHCSIQDMKRFVMAYANNPIPFPTNTIASDITYNGMTPSVPLVNPQGEPESQSPVNYGQTGTYNAPCCF